MTQNVMVIYGKGGVGKSTVATHLAVSSVRLRRRVLLVGCDPKCDSSMRLRRGGQLRTAVDSVAAGRGLTFEGLLMSTPVGVDVIETGGPEPGRGCGGRGVANVCQMLAQETEALERYDTVIFDVLGDLVCGGFMAPLQLGRPSSVLIVTSEETASLFVANNLARALQTPHLDMIRLVGLLANLREARPGEDVVRAFASRLSIDLLEIFHRDPSVLRAEIHSRTTIDEDPAADISKQFLRLARLLEDRIGQGPSGRTTPLDRDEFWEFARLQEQRRLDPL